MNSTNYLANALLIDSIDKVRNKLLAALDYAAVHRLRIDEDIEGDFNLICKSLSDVSEEMMSYINRPIYDPRRVEVVETSREVLEQTLHTINSAIMSNVTCNKASREHTILLEGYGERLMNAKSTILDAIRNFGVEYE